MTANQIGKVTVRQLLARVHDLNTESPDATAPRRIGISYELDLIAAELECRYPQPR